MKKIFLPLMIFVLATPNLSANAGIFDFLSSDNDEYWVNNFRRNKYYPIRFYADSFVVDVPEPRETEKKTFSTHEYDHNVVVSAAVGQRMYDAETYSVSNHITYSDEYQALTDMEIYHAQNTIKIKKGDKFVPLGEVEINDEYVLVFQVPDTSYLIMIDSDGRLLPTIGYFYKKKKLMLTADKVSVLPHGAGFEPSVDSVEHVTEPKSEFELVYDGLQGDIAQFSYTIDGKTEQFILPTTENMLEIGDIRIEIVNYFDDYIEYKILD